MNELLNGGRRSNHGITSLGSAPELNKKSKGVKSRRRSEGAENHTRHSQQNRVEVLEAENEKLRAIAKRWKRKYEQEVQVNQALGKRVKAWKDDYRALELECDALRRALDNHQAMMRVSPVSPMDSPFLDTDFAKEINLSPQQQLQVEQQQRPSRVLETLSQGLRVDTGHQHSRREALLSHVLLLERGKDNPVFGLAIDGSEIPDNLAQFCFPCHSPNSESEQQHDAFGGGKEPYLFMLSGEAATPLSPQLSCIDGATFGACLHIEDSLCICIVSRNPLLELFSQLLCSLADVFMDEDADVENALAELDTLLHSQETRDFGPGKTISLGNFASWTWPVSCHRPLDLLLEWSLPHLMKTLSVDQILFLVGCLLVEVKVILVSKDLAQLSGCMFALLSLLKPCRWVQPFIPVLPHTLSMVCDAPVPVFVGVTSAPKESEDTEEPPSPSVVDSPRQSERHEAVTLDLQNGAMHLSKGLCTSYHTVKLPGLSHLNGLLGDKDSIHDLEDVLQEHVTQMLGACKYFGQATTTLAVMNAQTSSRALTRAEDKLADLVPCLSRDVTISPPWQYLARLQSTQMYMQWVEASRTRLGITGQFQLQALLSPEESESDSDL